MVRSIVKVFVLIARCIASARKRSRQRPPRSACPPSAAT